MPHTYRFADAARTTVVRDDGATFPWSSNLTPAVVGASLGGFVGEDYRMDGCPMPMNPFEAEPHTIKTTEVSTTEPLKLRRRRLGASPKAKPKAKAKAKSKAWSKSKPPGKRKYR